jgi:hypothetical protein
VIMTTASISEAHRNGGRARNRQIHNPIRRRKPSLSAQARERDGFSTAC